MDEDTGSDTAGSVPASGSESKSAPDSEASPGFEARLHVDGIEVDAADVALLRAVDREGSLNAAAASLSRSYSRAHDRVTALEAALGPLVERQRGGSDGGGSRLTPRARDLIARFARLRAALAGTAAVEATVLDGRVRERTGSTAVVDTSAGSVRAVLVGAGDDDAVQVTIRADAVTLQDPSAAPPDGATSARNRLEGTVTAITARTDPTGSTAGPEADADDGTGEGPPDDALALVSVDVGGVGTLSALVTPESRTRLGLAPGRTVVATWKATATRATPVRG